MLVLAEEQLKGDGENGPGGSKMNGAGATYEMLKSLAFS